MTRDEPKPDPAPKVTRCAECQHVHLCSVVDEWPELVQPGFPDGEWMCRYCQMSDYAHDPGDEGVTDDSRG